MAEGIHPQGSMVVGEYRKTINNSVVVQYFKSDGALDSIYDDVTRRKQEKDNWCWVTSAEVVGKYVNPSSPDSQSSVVASMFLHDFDLPGFNFMSEIALKKFAADKIRVSGIHGKPMDFMQTTELISSANPLIGVLKWTATTGHIVVISGYGVKEEKIRIIDPWENTATTFVPYDKAINGFNFLTGTGKYTDCIYIGR